MYCNHPSRARGPRPGEKLPVPKLFRRARTAVPAQLPREDAAVWHGAARLLGTAPCTAHCQKPPPSYSRLCAVSTRQSRPLLRAAPRQRGRFFIIFGPLSAIAAVRARRCMGRQTARCAYRMRSAGLVIFRHRRIPAREVSIEQKSPPCWRLERLHTREASSGRISVDLARTVNGRLSMTQCPGARSQRVE